MPLQAVTYTGNVNQEDRALPVTSDEDKYLFTSQMFSLAGICAI
jgi:hypothetical protein